MAAVFVATESGIRIFNNGSEANTELAGRPVWALAAESDGACLAVVDKEEIWRRDATGAWSIVAKAGIALQCITSVKGEIFAGGMDEAALLRISALGEVQRLPGFDNTPGREQWFAGGPHWGSRINGDCGRPRNPRRCPCRRHSALAGRRRNLDADHSSQLRRPRNPRTPDTTGTRRRRRRVRLMR